MSEENDELLLELEKEKEKRLNDKLLRFNELSKELELTEEEFKLYPKASIEELEASITNLRILKGRINQMKDFTDNPDYKGDPSKPFFGIGPKKGTGKKSEPSKKSLRKFNAMQIFDKMMAPTHDDEKFSSDCFVIRLYTNPIDKIGRKI